MIFDLCNISDIGLCDDDVGDDVSHSDVLHIDAMFCYFIYPRDS